MDKTCIRFYFKNKKSFNNDHNQINLYKKRPILKKSSRGVDCQYEDPYYSVKCLCEMVYNHTSNMYDIRVFDCIILDEKIDNKKRWINVNWKIDNLQKNFHYYVTSYFNPKIRYIEPIKDKYIICRAQFSSILIFFILKLKVKCLRIKRNIKKRNY